jgi:hypothetical protein
VIAAVEAGEPGAEPVEPAVVEAAAGLGGEDEDLSEETPAMEEA